MRRLGVVACAVALAGAVSLPAQAAVAGDPVGMTDGFYADPDSNPARWVQDHSGDPEAPAIRTAIAERPGARWFTDANSDAAAQVSAYTSAAEATGKLPILVAYAMPGRDCGGDSGGGADSAARYRSWISGFAAGIGDRPAVVVIEPDALAQLDCLPADARQTRIDLLRFAVDQFATHAPNTWAYLDAGNATWVAAHDMANRLRQVDVARIRGFALNTSNYYTTAETVTKGKAIDAALGTATHYVVDTSRNGNGSTGDGQWCNPQGRRLGTPSRTDPNTGDGADLLLWVKVPGDSDGDCGIGTGIPAGTFSPDLARHLIDGN